LNWQAIKETIEQARIGAFNKLFDKIFLFLRLIIGITWKLSADHIHIFLVENLTGLMQKRHSDRKRYFEEQRYTTQKYVIPFIEEIVAINEQTSILEVGCGEGGNLVPFLEAGCKRIVGVDMLKEKIENATQFINGKANSQKIEFLVNDIYNVNPESTGKFDIILTKDVLEHIHDQERFMPFIKRFLKPDGKIFLGFPPWQNPFGGHQQICESKLLCILPYFHLLPRVLYISILKFFGESNRKICALLEIKDTRISIEKFERIVKTTNYRTEKQTFYLVNPNYEIKFGLKPRRAWKLISSIPYVRNFYITAVYYVISNNESN